MLQSITVAIPIHDLTFYGFDNLQSKTILRYLWKIPRTNS